MSATFWNMRRRQRAALKAKSETVQTTEKPVEVKTVEEQDEKPTKKGGVKNDKGTNRKS